MILAKSLPLLAVATTVALSIGCAAPPADQETSSSNAIALVADAETGCPADTLCIWENANYTGSAYFLSATYLGQFTDIIQKDPAGATTCLALPDGFGVSSVDNNIGNWVIELGAHPNVALEYSPGNKTPDLGAIYDGKYNDQIFCIYRPAGR